jgi:transposase
MDRETLDSLDKETLIRLILSQAEAIERLTNEVEALRADIVKLHAENAELRAKLDLPPKTPENSSTPPSQENKVWGEEGRMSEGRWKNPHAGAHRPLHPNPTTKRDVVARSCQHCGAFFLDTPQFVCESYDHIEIPRIVPHVTRVSLLGGACPCCARKFKAEPPQDMPKGSPFGPNLRALVIYLRFTQGIAFERLATLLSDLLGLDISEGALVNMLDAARASFTAATAAIRAKLLGGTILQSDETGLRVGKQNWWLWVFHHDDSALFIAAPSRAKKVVEDFLGDFRPDFWVSDRYGGQMGWAAVNNQVCLAHLIRDVQYAIDAGDEIFALELRHLLGRACRIGRRRERLADATLKTYAARLNARLDELMRLAPAHEAGVKLQRMIKRTRQYLFVFVTNRDIPATNNGSERALRPCVVFRKITNGFRTEWGAKLYADIRSVIETARRRSIGALEAIRLTLAGTPIAEST